MGIMGASPPAAWAVNDVCAGVLIQGAGVRGSCGLWGIYFLFPLRESVVGVRCCEVSATIRADPLGEKVFRGAIAWGGMESGCSSSRRPNGKTWRVRHACVKFQFY